MQISWIIRGNDDVVVIIADHEGEYDEIQYLWIIRGDDGVGINSDRERESVEFQYLWRIHGNEDAVGIASDC